MKRIMLVALLVGLSASALVAQEAEKPNDAKKTEKPKLLEMKKVLELVEKYRHAVYRADMEELALKLEEQLAPRAEEILETLKIDKTPTPGDIRMLGFARTEKATPLLLKLLKSKDNELRRAAAFALGVSGDAKAVEELHGCIDDKDLGVAIQSMIAAGRLGQPESLEPLKKQMGNKDLIRRLAAVRALGLLGDERATDTLQERLVHSEDPLENVAIYDALNVIAGDDLTRVLKQFEGVADALEKHGTGGQTQLAQAAISDALRRIIEKAEEQSGSGSGKGKGKGKKRQTSQGKGQGQGKSSGAQGMGGSSPATKSHGGGAPEVASQFNDTSRTPGVAWGTLPPAVQEEITAALKQQLPERYKNLLRVYYKILAEGK